MNNDIVVQKVMDLLLRGDSSVLKQLMKQYLNSEIIDIKETGKGIYVDFSILDSDLRVKGKGIKENFVFGDVYGEISQEYGDVEFILFIKDGYIKTLEGFTYFPDGWSKIRDDIEFKYFTKKEI